MNFDHDRAIDGRKKRKQQVHISLLANWRGRGVRGGYRCCM